jgi:hypothetical protein
LIVVPICGCTPVKMGKPSIMFEILWNPQSGEVLIDDVSVGWAGDEENAERAALYFVRFNEQIKIERDQTAKEIV